VATLALTELKRLELGIGGDVVLLINDPEIIVTTDPEPLCRRVIACAAQ